MSKKHRKPAPIFAVISTEEGLASAANRYVSLSLELISKRAAHERWIAELNAAFDAEIAEKVAEVNGLATAAQLYCEAHRELFPDGARSREYRNARVGFRWNPTKVEKRLSRDTWDAIGERLAELPWGEEFVTYKPPTVNKELLLNRQAELTPEQLQAAGIQFEKGETFFIDPANDSVAPVRKEAA
ncbi:MAG: host-nuclease inhibitor Gam family protein [Verrucomicrobiota bacterium]